MPLYALKLHFHTPLHIGRGVDEMDKSAQIYGSDALKSALYAIGLTYNLQWKEQPDYFFHNFRISSAFPFCNDVFFLPKPAAMRFEMPSIEESSLVKKSKKILFVDTELIRQWVDNPTKPVKLAKESISPDGVYAFALSAKQFLYSEVQQRVTVPLEGSGEDARPFYLDRLYFTEGSGLYFLAQFENKEIKAAILQSLFLLGTTGIGTDRHVGNGQFTFDDNKDLQELVLPQSNTQGLQMALGLYLPQQEEIKTIDLNNSNWALVRRGGYMAASTHEKFMSLRKSSIHFFAEGSAFKCTKPLQGRYENLQPQWNDADMHPVWRCGRPLFMNF